MKTVQSENLSAMSRGFSAKNLPQLVWLFFICTSLLMSSGRLGSLDSSDQLQAAFYAVHRGQFGAALPPGGMQHTLVQGKPAYIPIHFWWQAPNKLYYQTHDVGNLTLFTPVAFLTSMVSKAPPEQQIENPPLIAKLVISLSFSMFGGITAFLVYQTIALFVRPRAAFVMATLFLPTTFLWPFCKTVWDIAPATMFATLLLYFCARILTEKGDIYLSHVAAAGFAIGMTALFRYSFAVFLILGLGLTLSCVYPRLRFAHYTIAIGSVVLSLLPCFISNHIRMGAFWHPATLIPRYVDYGVTLNGNFLRGFFGLTLSPNRGMFVYCPIFFLLFALPRIGRHLTLPARRLCLIFVLIALIYVCTNAKMSSWSGFIGWGPRYLVIVLSFLYVPLSLVVVQLWDSTRYSKIVRAALVILFSLTAVNNVPPALVNWGLAISEDEQAHDQYANGFYAQQAVWRGLVLGIQGKPIPVRASLGKDYRTVDNAKFPDLWLVRLIQKGGKTSVVGILILITVGGIALLAATKIVQSGSKGFDSIDEKRSGIVESF